MPNELTRVGSRRFLAVDQGAVNSATSILKCNAAVETAARGDTVLR